MALALFVILMGAGFVEQADAATFTVGTNSDPAGSCTPTSSSSCSLRQIINYENGLATTPNPVDTIVVPTGSYGLSLGALTIKQSLSIAGAGARTTFINQFSSTADRVFDILVPTDPTTGLQSGPPPTVVISGLDIAFGTADSANNFFGGDIRNQGTLTLTQDAVTNGTATSGSGGGISNDGGTLTVTHSLVSGNTSTNPNGGGDSGGIQNFGPNPVTGTAGKLAVDNSTIARNSAALGGGIFSWCSGTNGACSSSGATNTTQITNSTIAFNDGGARSTTGGGLLAGEGTISVENSIVALNTVDTPSAGTPSNCGTTSPGTISSLGYNLETGTDCGFTSTGDLQITNPQFSSTSPQDNGGNTDTLGLDATSPAVDAIPLGVSGCSGTDQRDVSRPQGTGCDIGAYELFQPLEGQQSSLEVAVACCAISVSPTIDWGDGTSSAGTVGPNGGPITGTHTYAEEGTYTGSVSWTDDAGPHMVPFDVKVPDAPLNNATGASFSATAGTPFSGQVATFTDADPGGNASDYSATITWGDDTSSAGTVSAGSGGQFVVSGTHTYATAGSFPTSIAISDAGGANATANGRATVAVPPPTVTAVSPSSGPAGGGTSVTITGANFTGATGVKFGSTAATGVTVNSATKITATSPAGSGTVDVTVTTPGGTSPTGSADRFAYVPVAPVVMTSAPVIQGSTGAAFSGVVDPEGLLTSAHFEYGLDPKYSGGGPVVYDQSTPVQQVGSDFSAHAVSASVSGLVPNALYHVRLVALNSAGTVNATDLTFTTAKDPAPPPPVLGKTANVTPVSGLVLIKPPPGKTLHAIGAAAPGLVKGKGFVPLTQARQIPDGSQIDARAGTLKVVVANGQRRHTQLATLAGSVFSLSQTRTGLQKGLTTFDLLESAFPGSPTYKSCSAHPAAHGLAQTAAKQPLSRSVLQTLHASDKNGRFRTRGRYSAGTVRGTKWDTIDRCDGTLTVVHRGTVDVLDFGRRKTIAVHAGHSYLAKALIARKHKK
jgi:hypothetical protein